MLMSIPVQPSLLGSVFHITFVPIGNKLLVSYTYFLVCLSTYAGGLLFVTCLTCNLVTCDIGRLDVACLAHSTSIGDCKPLPSQIFLYNIREKKLGFSPIFLALDNKLFRRGTYFAANPLDWWLCDGLVNGVHSYLPLLV